MTHARQLTAFMEGELTYTLGPDSGVGLAFAHRGPRTTAAVDLRVGVGAVGVTAAVVRRVGPRHHARLAGKLGTMGIEADRVSIKATTTEWLGFEGREEGISVSAVALIYKY